MPLFETEAVVTGASRLGEADLLVSFFTRDYGKIKAVARGARILTSRFSGFIQPLSVLEIIYFGSEKQELYRLNSCDPVQIHDFARQFEKAVISCCIAEVLEHCCGPGEMALPMYDLALQGIKLLDEGERSPGLALSFAMKAFTLSGYMPHLEDCVACGRSLENRRMNYSAARGGILCVDCSAKEGGNSPVSMGCLKFLRATQGLDLKRSSRIKLSTGLRKEAREMIFNHLAYYLGREARALRFLEL
jgi:DNA repair protein RecO (recombination protein O)